MRQCLYAILSHSLHKCSWPEHQSPCGLSGSLLATTDVLQSHNWAILSPCSRLISCPWHRLLLEGRFGREHAALSWNWNSCGCWSEEKASSWCSARKNTAGQDSRPLGSTVPIYYLFSLNWGLYDNLCDCSKHPLLIGIHIPSLSERTHPMGHLNCTEYTHASQPYKHTHTHTHTHTHNNNNKGEYIW